MFIILIILSISIGVYFLKKNYEYWERRGVPGPKPTFLVGNLGQSFLMKKSPFEVFTDIYNKYQNHPFVGIYKTGTPALLIREPELIKEITLKSFDSFQANDIKVDKEVDPLFGRNPFVLKGEEWRVVRTQLTPAFTSGKMKWIYPLLEDVSKQMVQYIDRKMEAFKTEGYEGKELCMKFTLSNVASCTFGIDAKCFEEENSKFRQIADQFLTPGGFASLKILLVTIFPFLSKFVSLKFTPKSVEDKLINIVVETVKYREENGIIRNDFLHFINQLKKSCKDYKFTDVDVAAHTSGFFVDGYETSSIVMSFLLYELAANPQVQKKLREEIYCHLNQNENSLPYEVLQTMPYLDAVVNESLRMHPAAFTLQKLCTKSYTYTPTDGDGIKKTVVIEKNTPIILPIYALQNDPQYFEQPEIFKPERFMGANKDNIQKFTFMPFGEGPRTCLGQRFGLLQIKVGVAHIIKNFEVSVNKKTKLPFTYSAVYFLVAPVGGIWLNFKRIKS